MALQSCKFGQTHCLVRIEPAAVPCLGRAEIIPYPSCFPDDGVAAWARVGTAVNW
jgi:hypothetical protein